MIQLSATFAERDALSARLARTPLAVFWLVAMGLVIAQFVATGGALLERQLGDTDDATRLLEVRDLMRSWNWFDPTTFSLGGDAGMLTHWSRLVDLPLAALLSFFELFVAPDRAELLMRATWPLIVLAPLAWAILAAVDRRAGRSAVVLAVILFASCWFGLYQFMLGRIDHHNVMIACTVGATLLLWATPGDVRNWRLAGILCGLALAVGYEALAPVVAIVLIVAVGGLWDARLAPAARLHDRLRRRFRFALFATLPPGRYLDIRCDAISLNLVAFAAIGGGGLLAVLGPLHKLPLLHRLAVLGAAGIAGLVVFAGLEPKCLAGPMGQLPPELNAIWTNYVLEAQSPLAKLTKGDSQSSLGILLFLVAGLALQARSVLASRDPVDAAMLVIMTVFVALACWQYKYLSYANLLLIAPMAVAIAGFKGTAEISRPTVQLAAAVMLNQMTLVMLGIALCDAIVAPSPPAAANTEKTLACLRNAPVRDLDVLPPGLIAANIDAGAYIATLTHHRALAGPYHRIADAIIANDRLFKSRSDRDAADRLAAAHVDYVVICDGLDAVDPKDGNATGTLRARLVAGDAPAFLVPVPPLSSEAIYNAWRVDKAKLSLRP